MSPDVKLSALETIGCESRFDPVEVAPATASVTATEMIPLQPAVRHRLSSVLGTVSRRIARFGAAGQLGSSEVLERGRWTGARC